MPPDRTSDPRNRSVDAEGRPATTVRAFLDGGALLPFGGHKGYALALLIELLCGGLTGAGLSERPDNIPTQEAGGNACFTIVIDIAHFRDLAQFRDSVDAFMGRLKRVKPAPGSRGVVIPGEPEALQRASLAKEGFSVDEETWGKIAAIARKHSVPLEDIL